jgi:hypothetical protein
MAGDVQDADERREKIWMNGGNIFWRRRRRFSLQCGPAGR